MKSLRYTTIAFVLVLCSAIVPLGMADEWSGYYENVSYNQDLTGGIEIPHGEADTLTVFVDGVSDGTVRSLQPDTNASACPYQDIEVGTANWGGFTGEIIQTGNSNRIRQTGHATSVTFYCPDNSTLTDMSFTVWRQDGTKFDRIYVSPNFGPDTIEGINTFPIDVNVTEGDFYGQSLGNVDAGQLFHANVGTGYAHYINTHKLAPGSDQDIDVSGWLTAEATFVIDMYVESPNFVAIGDSITSGHPQYRSYIESLGATYVGTPSTSYEYQLGALGNWSYQNMGIGGQTTTQIKARYSADAIDPNPGFIIILAGVNDVAASASTSTITSNVEWMLSEAQTNDIPVVLVSILPWTNGNAAQMVQVDEINEDYESLAIEYGALFVDARDALGVDRAGYYTGNNWDLNPSYDIDGVHINSAGNGALAQVIYDALDTSSLFVDGTAISLDGTIYTTYDTGTGYTASDVEAGSVHVKSSEETATSNTVTVTEYFTENVTVVSDSEIQDYRYVTITHESTRNATDGTITYNIGDASPFGMIDVASTNVNADAELNADSNTITITTGALLFDSVYTYSMTLWPPNTMESLFDADNGFDVVGNLYELEQDLTGGLFAYVLVSISFISMWVLSRKVIVPAVVFTFVGFPIMMIAPWELKGPAILMFVFGVSGIIYKWFKE